VPLIDEGPEQNRLAFLLHRLAEGTIEWSAEQEARALIAAQANCAKAAAGWIALQEMAQTETEDMPKGIVDKAVAEPNAQRALTAFVILHSCVSVETLMYDDQDEENPPELRPQQLAEIMGRLPKDPASLHFLARMGRPPRTDLLQACLEAAGPSLLAELVGETDLMAAMAIFREMAQSPAPVKRHPSLSGTKGSAMHKQEQAAKKPKAHRQNKFDRYLEGLLSPDVKVRGQILANMFDYTDAIPPHYCDPIARAFVRLFSDSDSNCRRSALSGSRRLEEFLEGEPRRAVAEALWQAVNDPEPNAEREAWVALAYYASELGEAQREAVVDRLLEAAKANPGNSFRAWDGLWRMRDRIPDSRVALVFGEAAPEIIAKRTGAEQWIGLLMHALVPRLFKNAPDWTLDWMLYLFGAGTGHFDTGSVRYVLCKNRSWLPATSTQRLIAQMWAVGTPAAAGAAAPPNQLQRFAALGVLASLHEWLSKDQRETVIRELEVQYNMGRPGDVGWWTNVLQDTSPAIPQEQALRMLARILSRAETDPTSPPWLGAQALLPLIGRLRPADVEVVLGRLRVLNGESPEPRIIVWARSILDRWPLTPPEGPAPDAPP